MDGSKQAIIRKYGALMELSADGRRPLGVEAVGPLASSLVYKHVRQLYGAEALDRITGERRKVEVEVRRLYRYDDRGRLVCGAGYVDRVVAMLRQGGYAVTVVELTEPSPREGALEPDWKRVGKRYEFRPKQEEIVALVADRIAARRGGVVQVPPGVGKSYLLAALGLLYPRARIAVTAPDVDNCNKTYHHLVKYMPDVGYVGDGRREQRRVTVYTAGSLHHCDADIDILFVDEAHRYMADKTSDVLARVGPRALKFGLTATPRGRIDGCDARMEALCGPIIYTMTWPEATRLGLIVPIEVRWLPIKLPDNPAAEVEHPVVRKKRGIWTNEGRNAAIAAAARTFPDDEQVLIMVATIEHAAYLRHLLPEFDLCYGTHDLDKFAKYVKDGVVLGDDFVPSGGERREAMRVAFERGDLKKVIATDVWSTGVSFDQLQVLIRADARSSAILDEQIPGRVSRTHTASGKRAGILIDCEDHFDRGFLAASHSRRANYKDKGWAQTIFQA